MNLSKGRTLNNLLSEEFILPLSDLIFGHKVYKYFEFLQKSQWWSKSEMEDYQNERLRELIYHSFHNVPYYNEVFKSRKLVPEDIRSSTDLEKLPVLTKEIIRKNFPHNIVAKNIPKNKLLLAGSSGSTGQPLQYYRTQDALGFSRASNLRGWYWMGYRLGSPYIKISTMPRNGFYKRMQDKFNNCLYLQSQKMDRQDIEHIIIQIRNSGKKILRGYPSSLYVLASYLEKNRIFDIKLLNINTTSEPLFPHMRNAIERQFHCKIFDSYGAEGLPVISECENHSRYHISSEAAILEYYRNGIKVTEGRAKMISTDLNNYATPFIRYDVKDYVTIDNSICSCGRCLPSVSTIEGRDTDILITPSGKYITFYFFAGYFEHLNYIDMFQMVQSEVDVFTLRIVINNNFSSHLLDKIKMDVKNVLGNDVKLNLEIVDDIPLTTSGKRRFFIRDCKIPLEL